MPSIENSVRGPECLPRSSRGRRGRAAPAFPGGGGDPARGSRSPGLSVPSARVHPGRTRAGRSLIDVRSWPVRVQLAFSLLAVEAEELHEGLLTLPRHPLRCGLAFRSEAFGPGPLPRSGKRASASSCLIRGPAGARSRDGSDRLTSRASTKRGRPERGRVRGFLPAVLRRFPWRRLDPSRREPRELSTRR